MELNTIILIGILGIVTFLIIRFLWKILGNIFKLVFLLLFLLAGFWILNPNLIEEYLGKEKKEKIESKIKNGSNKLKENIKDI